MTTRTVPAAAPAGSGAPHRLRVDGRAVATNGTTRWVRTASHPRPRLGWTVPLLRDGQRQTAYRVQLSRQAPDRDPTPVLDTGVRESSEPWHLLAAPLPSESRLRWRVAVRDEEHRWSPWSVADPLETGPNEYRDWYADWVSVPALHSVRIPLVLDQDADRARLHLTAQGLVRAVLDGQVVNAGALDPSRTDSCRALYRSYDVTDLCRAGEHLLELTLARGAWEPTGLLPRVLASCVVEQPDGTLLRLGTRDGLETRPSQVVQEEPFYLERHDLRTPDPAGVRGRTAALTPLAGRGAPDRPPLEVTPDPGPPVHVLGTLVPELIGVQGSRRVYDVGTNIAGRVRLQTSGSWPAGVEVRVVHGEHLGPDGGVDTTNLTLPRDADRARQVLEFLVSGTDGEVLEAWFSYAGFRFVQVDGVPPGAGLEVTAHPLHSDLVSTGPLTTDSPVVQRLVQRGRRTLLNNVHSIPEDCPTREQAGWTGDTASVTELELAAFDVEGFFTKWLGDLRTSQLDEGAVPAIAPHLSPTPTPPDPVWGAALPRVLLGHWLHYGDPRVLAEHLPGLRRWTDWLLTCVGERGVVDGAPISYGHDWLGLAQTPPELHHTAATIDAFSVLSRLEAERGDAVAARAAAAVVERLRAAARAAFVDPGARVVANGSQGSWAIALESGLLGPDERGWAVAALVAAVRERGNRVSSGFATTRTVVRALAHADQDQVLADVLDQRDEPGVGAMVASDMGTFWECWWVDPANTGTGSLDHVGLGGPFAGWVWQRLAGLQPLAAGFARFLVDPHPVVGLDRLRLTTRTVRGEIDLGWERDGEQVVLDLVVPVSATAVVPTPDGPLELGSGRHRVELPRPTRGRHRPPAAPPWSPPARALRSADVDREPLLVTHPGTRVRPVSTPDGSHGSGATLEVLDHGLRCMPVPHEQEAGPVLRVTAGAGSTEVLARFEVDLDLDDVVFGYARLDLCSSPPPGPVQTVLRLHAADGGVLTGTAKVWPAGWNRVTVDLAGWPGGSRLVAVEAGIRLVGTGPARPGSPDPGRPLAVDVGPVGLSRSRRCW